MSFEKAYFLYLTVILLFASTTKYAKSISYLAKPLCECHHLLMKCRIGLAVLFLHRSRGWKVFMYVRVCLCKNVCKYLRGCNFYVITIKFCTNRKVKFEDRLWGLIGTPRVYFQITYYMYYLNNFSPKALSLEVTS